MPMLRRCCCCRNLRTGSIICAIWILLWSVISMGIVISDLDALYNDPESNIFNIFKTENSRNALIALNWASVSIAFCAFISSVVAIPGVLMNKHFMLIPWMISVLLMIIFDTTSIIFFLVTAGFSKAHIIFLLLWIFTTLANIYSELCVLSHYQEVKAGRGRPEHYARNSSGVRYSSAVQHIHIGESTPPPCITSQHTVYSFHSQTLYDDAEGDNSKQDGTINGSTNGPIPNGVFTNGRVLTLRPVTSLPADMNARYSGNAYTGSIEMKVVDSMPVIVDNSNNNGGARPKGKVRRFRTVSESAATQRNPDTSTNYISSLRNITERKESESEETGKTSAEFCIGGSSVIEKEEISLTASELEMAGRR